MAYEKGLVVAPHQIRARTRILEPRSNIGLFPPSTVLHDETLLAEREDGDSKAPNTGGVYTQLQGLGPSTLREIFYRRLILAFLLLSTIVLVGLFVLEDSVHAALRRPAEVPGPLEMGFRNLALNKTRFRTRNSTKGESLSSSNRRGKRPRGSAVVGVEETKAARRGSSARGTVGRFPLIDRATLAAKLGGISGYYEREREWPELYEYNDDTRGERTTRRWPPMITRIPESSRPSPKKSYPPPLSPLPSIPPPSIQAFLDDGCGSDSDAPPTTASQDRPHESRGRKPKFLFPLRIAEQESKARIHFLQLVQLAHRLDRVLVLPNVAKSRIGACYKWGFEVYYALERFCLAGDVDEGVGEDPQGEPTDKRRNTPRYITLEDFKLWSDYYRLHANKTSIHSQLVSIASSMPEGIAASSSSFSSSRSSFSQVATAAIVIDRYPTSLAAHTEFPGCFPSKFPQLSLDPTSLYVALDRQGPSLVAASEEGEYEFGDALFRALKGATATRRALGLHGHNGLAGVAGEGEGTGLDQHPMQAEDARDVVDEDEEGEEESEPDVLVVNWDLRRPIFDLSPLPSTLAAEPAKEIPSTLPYSPSLYTLSNLLSPRHQNDNETGKGGGEQQQPYIAIHWRMETVPLDVLEDCAYALIDVLSNLSAEIELEHSQLDSSAQWGDSNRERKRTKIWFASDYPYPLSLAPTDQDSRTGIRVPKSGTFREFNAAHERAIRILKSAFHPPSSSASDVGQDGEEGNWDEGEAGGGELADWAELMDISASIQAHASTIMEGIENRSNNTAAGGPWGNPTTASELLQDTGVLGILDKLIVTQADWFVSGSKRCSRQSSFTRQVIEARQADGSGRRNVVTLF
ncbi:hypothetical protein H1R20_g8405, partial [Candolleomyces eurysporus]